MELRHLRHFVAVAEELHFARAAERLGMEQSPLSHSIRNLETELKAKLFHRTSRRTWLTPAGMRFLSEAKKILSHLEAAKAAVLDEASDGFDLLRVILADDIAGDQFTKFLNELEQHRTSITVNVQEHSYDRAIQLIREKGADFVFSLDDRDVAGLYHVRAWSERLLAITALSHPLAQRDHISLAELRDQRLALPSIERGLGFRTQIQRLFGDHDVPLSETIDFRCWNTANSLVAAGRALAICPVSFVTMVAPVATIPISESDAEIVTWLLHPDDDSSPATPFVLEVISSLARVPSVGSSGLDAS